MKPSTVAAEAKLLAGSLETLASDMRRAIEHDGLGDVWTKDYAEHVRGRLETVESIIADVRRKVAVESIGAKVQP